ncbi:MULTISPECIES: hypothetical protein [unclassified Endozoicomonas]|uniref:hypothetical protein n=1 Tax=unclassified Endozoicomonas TaxID=2644528 RepID=UPI003BB6A0E6
MTEVPLTVKSCKSSISSLKGHYLDNQVLALLCSATGQEQGLDFPAILLQLESINEEQRQGQQGKYRMTFKLKSSFNINPMPFAPA